jgi:hypothetical protein
LKLAAYAKAGTECQAACTISGYLASDCDDNTQR